MAMLTKLYKTLNKRKLITTQDKWLKSGGAKELIKHSQKRRRLANNLLIDSLESVCETSMCDDVNFGGE